jgi:hypothetical protein
LFAAILNRIARRALPPPVVCRMPAENATAERKKLWTQGAVCSLPAAKP